MAITLVSGLLQGLVYQAYQRPHCGRRGERKQEPTRQFPDAASFEELDEKDASLEKAADVLKKTAFLQNTH